MIVLFFIKSSAFSLNDTISAVVSEAGTLLTVNKLVEVSCFKRIKLYMAALILNQRESIKVTLF